MSRLTVNVIIACRPTTDCHNGCSQKRVKRASQNSVIVCNTLYNGQTEVQTQVIRIPGCPERKERFRSFTSSISSEVWN